MKAITMQTILLAMCTVLGNLGVQASSHGTHESRHVCVHDELMAEHPIHPIVTEQVYENHPWDKNHANRTKAGVPTTPWAPIRITPYYDAMCGSSPCVQVTGEQLTYLHEIVDGASQRLAELLQVRPTVGGQTYKNTKCGAATIPSAHRSPNAAQTDFIIYVATSSVDTCACTSSVLAYAGPCEFDQYMRPIAGIATFCAGSICPTDGQSCNKCPASEMVTDKENNIGVAAHEITHALGFSSGMFTYYRDPSGNTWPAVTQTFSERGYTTTKLVTPNAKKQAQLHFDCDSLNGAEVEIQGGSGTAGSHLETRTFWNEYMTGDAKSGSLVFSPVSLGVLQDSGWYNPVYEAADTLKWGNSAGCAFATETCLNKDTQAIVSGGEKFFCNKAQSGCNWDRSAKGYCMVNKYSASLPTEYQYFDEDGTMGGYTSADYCPIRLEYSNQQCWDVNDWNPSPGYSDYLNGDYLGTNSYCFDSTLYRTQWGGSTRGYACYKYQCELSGGKMTLKITAWDAAKNTAIAAQPCPTAGGTVTLSDMTGWTGTITCPAVTTLCSSTCPNSCSGHGTCNTQGVCECSIGYYGVDCSLKHCPNDCNGHGTCDGTQGKCSCSTGYKGDGCDTCSSGYKGYPTCVLACNPACVHGDCDEDSGKCDCDDGYTGEACNMVEPKTLDPNIEQTITTPTSSMSYWAVSFDTISDISVKLRFSSTCTGKFYIGHGTNTNPAYGNANNDADWTKATGIVSNGYTTYTLKRNYASVWETTYIGVDSGTCTTLYLSAITNCANYYTGAGVCQSHGVCDTVTFSVCSCDEGYIGSDCSATIATTSEISGTAMAYYDMDLPADGADKYKVTFSLTSSKSSAGGMVYLRQSDVPVPSRGYVDYSVAVSASKDASVEVENSQYYMAFEGNDASATYTLEASYEEAVEDDGDSDDSGSNAGAIAAAVIIPLLLIGAIVGLFIWYRKNPNNAIAKKLETFGKKKPASDEPNLYRMM